MKKLIENLRALFAAVSEDMRKIGIFLIGAGQLGILVDNDKMTGWAGVLVMAVGIIAWAFGLYLAQQLADKVQEK
ncbi:hypothetical protein PSH47_15920 [Pseudoalteromonas sp. CST5]|jgi:hypothetical protein|uniref:hypothetical protein n=1 Tax=unclassified Pseudoalteromonas TaxID=194690 RepID=UPI0023595B79|nr:MULTISPECIES: hypothetical protein [unclassified Pseudoalteromonas]MDC9514482.1 hypothetical protein [Pseudoalteromonas sp. CST1]MDC9538928.1 hypothetical protein [Pseudoalteromonas sp. CST3]MDC9543045.1 hypothetical protein [Pseudoalteromonas sp. CST2]MDC9545863.1 hypothetical protein [Pseudoalteromonas sp. CST4]MDC9550621.1 hypothetical protein [Pseudoalteromonas sp. CST5]